MLLSMIYFEDHPALKALHELEPNETSMNMPGPASLNKNEKNVLGATYFTEPRKDIRNSKLEVAGWSEFLKKKKRKANIYWSKT